MNNIKQILQELFPGTQDSVLEEASHILEIYASSFGVNTKLRLCHFLAQVAHESGKFQALSENLNYSQSGLLKIFPKYFPTAALAAAYNKQPAKIANRVYANRYGNGNEASGDGYKYRGRGLIGVTFKSNYIAFGKAIGEDVVTNPDLVAQPKYAVLAAGWYWDSRKINALADKDDVLGVTKAINGGTNGLDARKALLVQCKKFIK